MIKKTVFLSFFRGYGHPAPTPGFAQGQGSRYNCNWCYFVNKPAASRSSLGIFSGLSYLSMIFPLAVHLKYIIWAINSFNSDIFSQTH